MKAFLKKATHALSRVFSNSRPDPSLNFLDPSIPSKQRQLVDAQLEKMYSGEIVPHFRVLIDVFEEIGNETSLNVLDAGCASAYYSEILNHLLSRPINYVGSDFSPEMLKMAKQKYPLLPLFRMDMRNMAWLDCSFDVVLSGAVIVHIKEWERAINEIARVSKK